MTDARIVRYPVSRADVALVGALEEFENLGMFLGSKIRADAHVVHGDFPLRVAIGRGRAVVVAARAIFGPKLCAALAARPAENCGFGVLAGGGEAAAVALAGGAPAGGGAAAVFFPVWQALRINVAAPERATRWKMAREEK